jgi:hypothetical protein
MATSGTSRWVLPNRVHDPRYQREQIPEDMYVPALY